MIAIAMFNAKDVRPIIKAYAGKDIPIEYAKKEAEAKQKATEEWERQHPNSAAGGAGWLSSTFGSVASVSFAMSRRIWLMCSLERQDLISL
jgi:import inner membrane translocase subunit TIM50